MSLETIVDISTLNNMGVIVSTDAAGANPVAVQDNQEVKPGYWLNGNGYTVHATTSDPGSGFVDVGKGFQTLAQLEMHLRRTLGGMLKRFAPAAEVVVEDEGVFVKLGAQKVKVAEYHKRHQFGGKRVQFEYFARDIPDQKVSE